MAASEGTIHNKPSKSRKFSRETSEPEFHYSLTIGFAFPTNIVHQSETYNFMILIMNLINFRFWSLLNLKELTHSLYRNSLLNHSSPFYKDYD